MNRGRIAQAVWTAAIALVAGWALIHTLAGRGVFYPYWIAMLGGGLAWSTLGYLIVRHRPDNRVGWVFLGMGVTGSVALVLGEAGVALAVSAPSGALMIGSESLRLGSLFVLGFLVLVYPTGYAPSRRWRWVGWVLGLTIVLQVVQTVIRPGPVLGSEWPDHLIIEIENPIRAAWLDGPSRLLNTLSFLGVIGFVGAAASIVARYRKAEAIERQQLKMFVFATVGGLVVLLGTTLLLPRQMEGLLGEVLWDSFVVVPPATATAAILRHGLYDIDRIISRTATYAIVTALLASLYALVAVVVPAAFLRSRSDTPDGVIAGATLLVAAAFVPIRRRVQNAIDRRFNRARYDAARTIEAFTARLRDEIDIDALGAELQAVVAKTMQPAHVSLWTRPHVGRSP